MPAALMSGAMTRSDIIVVGAGLSGLLAAIAMADPDYGAGRTVRLIDAGQIMRADEDGRATTLTPSALRALKRLGVALPDLAEMTGMHVGEGDQYSPWTFDLGTAQALDAKDRSTPLAYIAENGALREAFLTRIAALPITLESDSRVKNLSLTKGACVTLDTGEDRVADLLLACDGRGSVMRGLADISVSDHDFKQYALVTTVAHKRRHEGSALQRFQTVGAIAALPLPDHGGVHRSQIIWSDRQIAIEAATQLPEQALIRLMDERLWHRLEMTGLTRPRQTFPLHARRAETLSIPRLALIGDAARTIHPLAGQGFNLAIRDIAALTDGIKDAVQTGQDIGTAGLIGYEQWRRMDETVLGLTTAGLSSAPKRGPGRLLGHLRRASFAAVDAVPSLHALIQSEAAGELGSRPNLLT